MVQRGRVRGLKIVKICLTSFKNAPYALQPCHFFVTYFFFFRLILVLLPKIYMAYLVKVSYGNPLTYIYVMEQVIKSVSQIK